MPDDLDWLSALVRRAKQVTRLYGSSQQVDYERLQAYLTRQQRRWQHLAEEPHRLRLEVVRPWYRRLHPQRYLESIQGIGQDSAAIYIAFIGDIQRFPSLRRFRGWTGMVAYSRKAGNPQLRAYSSPKLVPISSRPQRIVTPRWPVYGIPRSPLSSTDR